MKIFNWVNKRFHHTTLNDGYAASKMKSVEPDTIISNADSEALMKQVDLADFLGGWKDGILTIGTLGCDPLKPNFNKNREYYALESEEEYEEEHVLDDDEEKYNAKHEELNPLMHTTFDDHNFEDEEAISDGTEEIMGFNKLIVVTPTPSPLPVMISPHHESNQGETIDDQKKKKKKGERITLADLFYADSDVKVKLDLDPAKVLVETSDEKTISLKKSKHGISFTKKFIPRVVKDNPHPIQDIKKLMKKMLKKKIHPELDLKNHKAECRVAAGTNDDDDDHNCNYHIEANDTASLLPI